MKTTKLLALLTALVLSLSCVGTVTFAASETTVYEYGYEDVNDIPVGGTSYRYPNSGNSSWHLNNAGNYGEVYLVNDAYSLDGNYMIVGGAGHEQSTFFEKTGRVLTNDFSIQFSFLNCGGVGKAGWSPFTLCIYPAASFSNTNLPDDTSYSIFSHYYNGGNMYMKGLDDVTSSFMTAKLVWYDVKASFGNVASGKPTYTIQVKKSADANWTTIIADYPLPSSWDCSQGLKMGRTIYHAGYDSIGFDNLVIKTVESYGISVTQPENGSLAVDGNLTSAAPGTSVTVTATPANGYVVKNILVNGKEQTVQNNKATFLLSSDSVVTAEMTEEGLPETIYSRETFSGNDFSDGVTDAYELVASGQSSWGLGFQGNYAQIWLVNDAKALDGKYAVCSPYGNGSSPMNWVIPETRLDLKENFTVDFSFMSPTTYPNGGANNWNKMKFNICMFPSASTTEGTVKDNAGALITIPVGDQITVMNDATSENAAAFTMAGDKWYDVRVKVNYDAQNPTYALYMKESSSETYSLLAADVAFPKSADYSEGIGVSGLFYLYSASWADSALALDDVMIYKTEAQPCAIALNAGLGGKLEFEGISGTNTTVAEGTSVTVKAVPDKGYVVDSFKVNGKDQALTDGKYTFTAASDAMIAVTFTMPGVGTVLQNRTYEAGVDYDCEIADGETYAVKSANPSGGCWWNNDGHPYRAGSYGYTYLVKHDVDSPKSGQYMQAKIQGGDTGMIFSTDAAKTYTDSFVYEFSFMNPTDDVKNAGCSGPSTFDVYLYPETAKSDGRSGEGKIATIAVEKNIKVVNDTEEVVYTHFTTTRNVWYDARFVIDQSTSVPTYDLYMKETADSVWTKVAENVSFPKSADYSRGLGTWASIGLTQPGATNGYYVLNVDDIRTTTVPELYAVDLAGTENGTVSIDGVSGDALVLPGAKVTINVTPDENYEIANVLVNGVPQPNDASFNLTVNENTVVTVTFKEIQKIAPAIAQVTMVDADSYQGNPAVFAYSKLNQYTDGSALNYGMYLWQGSVADKDSATILPLYAMVDAENNAVATPGAAFAIRVFGDAIKVGNTYSMQPFVGDVTGDAVEKTLAE